MNRVSKDGKKMQLGEELANNIVEGIDTVLAYLDIYQPDLEQCLRMAVESLVEEQARLLQEAKVHGLTESDIEEIERKALEDVLRIHEVANTDREGWMDLREAVRQFVTSGSYTHFCEKVYPAPIASKKEFGPSIALKT